MRDNGIRLQLEICLRCPALYRERKINIVPGRFLLLHQGRATMAQLHYANQKMERS